MTRATALDRRRSLGERVLGALSRSPDDPMVAAEEAITLGDALADLLRFFPDLRERVAGRRVLDFGCGSGRQAVALAAAGAAYVLGVDTNPTALARARELARREGRAVEFAARIPEAVEGSFDVVISKDSMEHFAEPATELARMAAALRPGGALLVTFGPPWFAPAGSHMQFFTAVPWVNLLFRERTVMRVRSRYRHDGAMRYEDVESGLNRMTISRFERLLGTSGLRVESNDYRCVKGLDFLGRMPLLRELFINNVSCVLRTGRPA